jgi:hypothetical protein
MASGVVEAACKPLVSQRCKQSGMRWHMAREQEILPCCALYHSDRFEWAWPLLVARDRRAVTRPDYGKESDINMKPTPKCL